MNESKLADEIEANPHGFAFLYPPNLKAIVAALRAAPSHEVLPAPIGYASNPLPPSSTDAPDRGPDPKAATPRTDAEIKRRSPGQLDVTFGGDAHLLGKETMQPVVSADFAKELERESDYWKREWALSPRSAIAPHTVVPFEPTKAMIDAGHKADRDFSNNVFHGRGHLDRAEFVWRAMIEAMATTDGRADAKEKP